ncbi:solute carrier family 22 member 3 [Grammomys surdaster]|uniref:solute carrier family 22 member 3 n=1 Tax=Grammomys surdaster TaxID=491861 RepID=UPI0010A08264|nr:solute carrier family 22 member 3 [Grammomys surdaster]
MPTFDQALRKAGEFGRFQRRVFLLLCLTGVTFAFLFVGVVFLGSQPDYYWCRGPRATTLAEHCAWSTEEEWNLTTPELHVPAERRSQGHCHRYLLEATNTSSELSCDPLAAFPNRSAPLVPCSSDWRYVETHSTIVSQFDLVCSNAWMLDLTQAILNLGFLAGAFTLGYAADRYGRLVIYLISCFGVGVTGVVVAFAPNFSVFVIFRFLQGVFGKGAWMTCFVIVTEIVGSKQRRIVGIVIQMFFTLGIIILPGIAYFTPSWQGIQLAISLPSFLFLLYYWVVPESPRWLITRKQGEKALQILRRVAKCNGKHLSSNYSEITVTDEEVSNPSCLDLIRTPQMRKCTLILMFAWFTSAVVYQGLVMRLGLIGGNLYIDFFISGLVELPGALLILLTIERLGRRLPFAASNVVAGVSCLVTAFLPEGIPWLRTTVATLGRLGITMAFEIVYLVNSELYPTTLRNFGVSLCSGLCDFGGIIAPFLLFRLAAIWLELPLIIFGILASVCGGLVMLLPETKGIALPETVEDVEKLGSSQLHQCGRKKKTQVSTSNV